MEAIYKPNIIFSLKEAVKGEGKGIPVIGRGGS
jgi:hypothetical protein